MWIMPTFQLSLNNNKYLIKYLQINIVNQLIDSKLIYIYKNPA